MSAEDPRQIVLEVKVDDPNLDLIERAFQNSKIKAETLSKENPIRIRIPATTRAVGLLLILLEELAPKGKIILDDGNTLDIDEDGLSKLRRLAIKSLSTTTTSASQVQQTLPPPTKPPPTSQLPNLQRETQSQEEEENQVKKSSTPSQFTENEPIIKSSTNQLGMMTFAFLVIVGISIGSATWLAISGRIGELSSDFILGACIIGAFSVIHRYASALRNTRA
jgi:PPE-repeat protein